MDFLSPPYFSENFIRKSFRIVKWQLLEQSCLDSKVGQRSRLPTRGFWCHSEWDQRCNFWKILQKLSVGKMCSRKHIKFSSGDFFSQFFKTQKSVFYKSDNNSIPKKFVLWVHGPSVFNSILVKMHFFCVLKF